MEEVEPTFREVTFEVDLIIVLVELGKIEGHGDHLGQEKEKGELGHHLVLDQVQELVWTEIEFDVLNAESMTTLQMNVQNWFPKILIGKVIVQGQYHCRQWYRSDAEQYLNI